MNSTNTNDERVRKIMGIDRPDRKAAEQAYTTTAFDYEANPVGSEEWCRFWDGWRAALSQPASEPVAPARFWIDCEYNEFRGALISMALVPESGPEFYEVLDCQKPGPWVAEHVMPILNKPAISLDQFHRRLSDYLNRWNAVHIIADWPEDIAHFCQALIVGPGERLNTPPLTLEVIRDDAPSDLPHNALEDARGMRRFALSKVAPRINEGSGRDAVSGWHPMQGYGPDYQGTLRFNTNAIVEYLLDHGPFDMNALAAKNFSEADRCQFAQLIGYSVSGFYGLSYAANYPHDEPSGVKEFLTTDATPPAAVGGAELDCPHSALDACDCYAANAGKS